MLNIFNIIKSPERIVREYFLKKLNVKRHYYLSYEGEGSVEIFLTNSSNIIDLLNLVKNKKKVIYGHEDNLGENYICIYNKKEYIFIISNSEVLNVVKNIVSKSNMFKRGTINKIIYDIEKEDNYCNLTEIKNKFDSIIVDKNKLILNLDIIPEKVITNQNKLYLLPIEFKRKNVIKRLEFEIDNFNKIISLKIDNYHPNSDDNGFYCLGNLRFENLNLLNICSIIDSIKVWNLISCYNIPVNLLDKLN